MKLGAVVQHRAVGPKRGRDPDLPGWVVLVLLPDSLRQQHRGAQSLCCRLCCFPRAKAQFLEALLRDLVARGDQAIRACFEILAMHGGDRLRRTLEHMRRPHRSGEIEPFSFEFGCEASIENVQAGKVELPQWCHESLRRAPLAV